MTLTIIRHIRKSEVDSKTLKLNHTQRSCTIHALNYKIALTLFGMSFFMYAKRMGGGKNYHPTLTFEPEELQSYFLACKLLQQCTFQKYIDFVLCQHNC